MCIFESSHRLSLLLKHSLPSPTSHLVHFSSSFTPQVRSQSLTSPGTPSWLPWPGPYPSRVCSHYLLGSGIGPVTISTSSAFKTFHALSQSLPSTKISLSNTTTILRVVICNDSSLPLDTSSAFKTIESFLLKILIPDGILRTITTTKSPFHRISHQLPVLAIVFSSSARSLNFGAYWAKD